MRWLDRLVLSISPRWGLSRIRSRAIAEIVARHYESASFGRRTANWNRSSSDANQASAASLSVLRAQARDLIRNNPWAARGARVIARNTVGTGIRPKALGASAAGAMDLWRRWGETTECDSDGRLTFYGLQKQVMRTMTESGEVLVRRRLRRPSDGLSIPMQLQVLEPDFLDVTRDNIPGQAGPGSFITQGVETDPLGRRIAYWLYDQHPGSGRMATPTSKRVPADSILHIFEQARPGQMRGPSWFAAVDTRLHDHDEYEDATLMKQKISACFAAFVTDIEGTATNLGADEGDDPSSGAPTDTLEPGLISHLSPGRDVKFSNPPSSDDHPGFTATVLRSVAAGLGVTYEDLTGDYSQSNYSSSRMGRISHFADVEDWRWTTLVPLFCQEAWLWAMEAASLANLIPVEAIQPAEWTAPALPMIDPEKEGLAMQRLVRAGALSHDDMVRQQGYDPDVFWAAYAAGLKRLDRLGIILDSDARKTTTSGAVQASPEAPAAPGAPPKTNGSAGPQKPAPAAGA